MSREVAANKVWQILMTAILLNTLLLFWLGMETEIGDAVMLQMSRSHSAIIIIAIIAIWVVIRAPGLLWYVFFVCVDKKIQHIAACQTLTLTHIIGDLAFSKCNFDLKEGFEYSGNHEVEELGHSIGVWGYIFCPCVGVWPCCCNKIIQIDVFTGKNLSNGIVKITWVYSDPKICRAKVDSHQPNLTAEADTGLVRAHDMTTSGMNMISEQADGRVGYWKTVFFLKRCSF